MRRCSTTIRSKFVTEYINPLINSDEFKNNSTGKNILKKLMIFVEKLINIRLLKIKKILKILLKNYILFMAILQLNMEILKLKIMEIL